LYNVKHDVFLNSGSQRTLVHLIVGNEASARVTGRALLVSFHEHHSVGFGVK